MTDYAWTEIRTAQLREHFAAGLSATQIAMEMGFKTRGPICGKLGRLGLTRADQPRTGPRRGRPPRERKPQAIRATPFRPPAIVAPLVPDAAPPPTIDSPEPPPQREFVCQIDDLTNTTCRWPYGESPPFLYCGAPADVADGRPYCAHHHRMATDRRGDRGRSDTVQPGLQPGERRWGATG